MATTSQRTQIPLAQVSDTLEKAVTGFDLARAADLTEMSVVREVRFAGLARDRERLVAKLGLSHPRVVALDRSLALHRQTSVEFKAESAAALLTPPRVNQSSWALHGNVLSSDRAPAQGLTVALYQNNTWVERLGHACTDPNGYFVLPVEDAGPAGSESLSLALVQRGKLVYLDPRPVTIQPGHVEYREVVMDKAGEPCPSPDGKRSPVLPAAPAPRAPA